MKAIVDKYGLLYHKQGKRKWPVRCPYAMGSSDAIESETGIIVRTTHFQPECGDWCSLWREIERGINVDENPCNSTWWRKDCRGHVHKYDAYEDQREVSDEIV